MDRIINIIYARIYVSSRYVYNTGDYFGKWMQLSDYESKKEFESAFRSLYPAEKEPELLILDWQDIPKHLITTKSLSSKIFKLIKLVSGYDKHQNTAFHLWLDKKSPGIFDYKSSEIIQYFETSYQGYYPQPEAFGRYYAKEYLGVTNPDFDYNQFGKQLLCGQYIQVEGHVFSWEYETKINKQSNY